MRRYRMKIVLALRDWGFKVLGLGFIVKNVPQKGEAEKGHGQISF